MKKKTRRVAALTIFTVLLFSPPLIVAVNRPATVKGLPLTPLYIFIAWALVVTLSFVVDRRR